MGKVFRVITERCIACGKCELACAFAHGSEGVPSKTRINIFAAARTSAAPSCVSNVMTPPARPSVRLALWNGAKRPEPLKCVATAVFAAACV